MAKNNNRQVSDRAAAFAANMGPSQHRQSIPIRNSSQRAKANEAYFNEGVIPNNWTVKQIPNKSSATRKGSAIAGAYKAASMLQNWNNQLPPESRVTVGKAGNAARKVGGAVVNAFKGSGKLENMKSGEANVMNASYGLSKAPNPKAVNLNSGIHPNTYANDYMASVDNLCSPMHMTAVELKIPTDSTFPLYQYFINTIAFDIQTRAQVNVNFDLDISVALSAEKLLFAFNNAIAGLQTYYYYSSILSYESDPRNKNEAMFDLRKNISAQYISDLYQLGKRLEDTPIPPRIVEWVRYMNMNFLSGDTQGSALLKTCMNVTHLNTFTTPSPIATALSNLNSADSIRTFTLLRRTIPQWRVGKLFDVPTVPVYDKNFLTIFSNLPMIYHNGTAFAFAANANDFTSSVSYNSFNNKLDGLAFAMCGVAVLNKVYPGMVFPRGNGSVSLPGSNRRSFAKIGAAAPAWTDVVNNAFLVNSRSESYALLTTTGTPLTVHLPGAEKCQGVSVNALSQTANNCLDFLFNINTIPRRGQLSHFNASGSK